MNKYEAGYYIKTKDYKAFIPSFINREYELFDLKILSLFGQASRYIGELNAYSKNLPNIEMFLFMLAVEEATKSNKIEGTKITLNEALAPEDEILPEMRDEYAEVMNYMSALEYAYENMTGTKSILDNPQKTNNKTFPFSSRLIKETHKILLSASRGQEKKPGEYRKSQNWIGGTMPSTASFVPPPHTYLTELLSDFENFWHNEKIDIPPLIKIAISHYQFETIHPFLDGNGRMGRLIILLQLIDSGLLELPTLYLSAYFERNRKQYYDALSLVREKNDINQWIKYFLEGVCDTAKYTVVKLKQIDDLNNKCREKIKKLTRSQINAGALMKFLYRKIFVTAKDVSKELNVDYQVANNLLKAFEKLGIVEVLRGKRNKTYMFKEYLDIFVLNKNS